MARPVLEIIAALERFQPSNGNWLALDALLTELFQSGSASQGISAMLNVFERFPTDDGAEVFWVIVHGLESLKGFERSLVESVRKLPSEFSLLMVHRLMNAGFKEVDGVELTFLLEQAALDQRAHPEIRQLANKFLGWHK